MERAPLPEVETDAAEPAGAAAENPPPRGWTRFLPLALVVAGIVIAFASGATRYLSLEALQERRDALLALVHQHPAAGFLAFVGVYVLVVALSLPGALIMSLTGGFLFGPFLGAAGAVIGATTGATVIFLVTRSAFGGVLRRRVRGRMVQDIEAGVREAAFSYLLMLRLIPIAPLWLVNVAAGLVEIPLRTYVAATALGIIPSSLIYCSIGSGLGRLFDKGGKPDLGRFIFDPQVFLPLVGLGVLSVVPAVLHARRERRRRAVAVSRPEGLG